MPQDTHQFHLKIMNNLKLHLISILCLFVLFQNNICLAKSDVKRDSDPKKTVKPEQRKKKSILFSAKKSGEKCKNPYISPRGLLLPMWDGYPEAENFSPVEMKLNIKEAVLEEKRREEKRREEKRREEKRLTTLIEKSRFSFSKSV